MQLSIGFIKFSDAIPSCHPFAIGCEYRSHIDGSIGHTDIRQLRSLSLVWPSPSYRYSTNWGYVSFSFDIFLAFFFLLFFFAVLFDMGFVIQAGSLLRWPRHAFGLASCRLPFYSFPFLAVRSSPLIFEFALQTDLVDALRNHVHSLQLFGLNYISFLFVCEHSSRHVLSMHTGVAFIWF